MSIKIIKRNEREKPPVSITPRVSKKDAARDFSRDVASTVTDWVREFQHKRRAGLLRVEE